MVERPKLLAWFFRPSVCCIRDLAGASASQRTEPATFVVRAVVSYTRIVRTHRRPDGRGTVPFPPVVADRAGRSDRAFFRLDFFSCPFISVGIPAFDDPFPSHRLQPDHIPTAIAGIESRQYDTALDGRACPARRQRHCASRYGSGSSRSLQWHPLTYVFDDSRRYLRLFDGAENQRA